MAALYSYHGVLNNRAAVTVAHTMRTIHWNSNPASDNMGERGYLYEFQRTIACYLLVSRHEYRAGRERLGGTRGRGLGNSARQRRLGLGCFPIWRRLFFKRRFRCTAA